MIAACVPRRRARLSAAAASLVFANLPGDYGIIEHYDGSAMLPNGNWADDGGFAASKVTVVTDAAAPMPAGFSDQKYLRCKTPANQTPGNAPFSLVRSFTAGEQFTYFYLAWSGRHETGWDNNPGPTHTKAGVKHIWVPPTGPGAGALYNWFYSSFDNRGSQQGVMDFQWIQQGDVDRQMGANLNQAAGDVYGRIGQWVKYESLFRMNAVEGVADGLLDVWIDDVHTHQYTNVDWSVQGTNPARTFRAAKIEQTYGGQGDQPGVDMFQDIAHLVMAGKAA